MYSCGNWHICMKCDVCFVCLHFLLFFSLVILKRYFHRYNNINNIFDFLSRIILFSIWIWLKKFGDSKLEKQIFTKILIWCWLFSIYSMEWTGISNIFDIWQKHWRIYLYGSSLFHSTGYALYLWMCAMIRGFFELFEYNFRKYIDDSSVR